MNFLINVAAISTTSGETSLKPFRKIGKVDLSANSSAIFNAFNLFSVLILGIAGVQLFSFGLLSELLIRTYHESQSRPIYRIRSISIPNQN